MQTFMSHSENSKSSSETAQSTPKLPNNSRNVLKQKVISYITQLANTLLHDGESPHLDILLL